MADTLNIAAIQTDSQPGDPSFPTPRKHVGSLVILSLLAFLNGCSPPATAPTPPPEKPAATSQDQSDAHANVAKNWAADRLVGLLSARLKVMHDVARWKWHAERPIEDPQREAELLTAMEQRAKDLQLDPQSVRNLFAAQLTASKLVQQADFDRWKAEGPPPKDGPDLQRDLRPQIDQLNRDLLECWSDCSPRLAQAEFRAYLLQKAHEVFSQQGIADDIQKAALAPLQESAAKSE